MLMECTGEGGAESAGRGHEGSHAEALGAGLERRAGLCPGSGHGLLSQPGQATAAQQAEA
jgi:hypothetical protein